MKTIELLNLYIQTINKIDDFFEYAYEDYTKKEIKNKIYLILDELTEKIIGRAIKDTCPECGGVMKIGIALEDKLSGMPDFIGSKEIVTLSSTGEVKLIEVLKCKKCGFSIKR